MVGSALDSIKYNKEENLLRLMSRRISCIFMGGYWRLTLGSYWWGWGNTEKLEFWYKVVKWNQRDMVDSLVLTLKVSKRDHHDPDLINQYWEDLVSSGEMYYNLIISWMRNWSNKGCQEPYPVWIIYLVAKTRKHK